MNNFVSLESINDKLFKGCIRDPLEKAIHAESECHAWFACSIFVW